MTKKKRIYHSAGKTGCPRIKETGILFYATHPRINLQWVKDLSLRPNTIKIPGKNIGNKFLDISLDNNFLDLIPKANAIKAKIVTKWDYIKSKSFCAAKETINKVKRQSMEGEKFANSDKGLIPKRHAC